MANEVAQYLRRELALLEKSRACGIPREINPDTAKLAYARAADEIERLESLQAANAGAPTMAATLGAIERGRAKQ